jgi:ATP-binding cassette subfamily F protein 3
MSVFDELRALEKEMETLAHRMSDVSPESAEYHQIADRYHEIEMTFVNRDGYSLDSKVGTVLAGLQFPKDDWDRPAKSFPVAGRCGSRWLNCCWTRRISC